MKKLMKATWLKTLLAQSPDEDIIVVASGVIEPQAPEADTTHTKNRKIGKSF